MRIVVSERTLLFILAVLAACLATATAALDRARTSVEPSSRRWVTPLPLALMGLPAGALPEQAQQVVAAASGPPGSTGPSAPATPPESKPGQQ